MMYLESKGKFIVPLKNIGLVHVDDDYDSLLHIHLDSGTQYTLKFPNEKMVYDAITTIKKYFDKLP